MNTLLNEVLRGGGDAELSGGVAESMAWRARGVGGVER